MSVVWLPLKCDFSFSAIITQKISCIRRTNALLRLSSVAAGQNRRYQTHNAVNMG